MQIHDLLDRGVAVKLDQEDMDNWTGPVWYISHLIASNPHSKTTPCRIVWNSSQPYQGVSLNSCLLKGPDFLNPLRGVLIRFREGVFAIIGDVTKMYNSIYLIEKECHMHRFLWRDEKTEEIGIYMIVRVNIGDRPAGCLNLVSTRKTK